MSVFIGQNRPVSRVKLDENYVCCVRGRYNFLIFVLYIIVTFI